jgi:hypothetical protein
MGKRENGFLMILNIDRIFSTGEVAQIVENVA